MEFLGILGFQDIVEFLIRKGADINAEDGRCRTALIQACEKGHMEIAKALLEAQADVNAAHADGRTALMMAASAGNKEIVDRTYSFALRIIKLVSSLPVNKVCQVNRKSLINW